MNYIGRFNLEFNPFIKNSKETLIETNNYKETKYRLDYLLLTKGFGLITGEPGLGKTSAIRNWANGLNPNVYKVVYLPLSTLNISEFYRQLSESLNGTPCYRKKDNFTEIQTAIRRYSIDKKITPVIILDEANYLPSNTLNDLKIIFNFEMDSKDLAVVILAGLPILNSTLNIRHNEPLKQRIVTSYNLEPLTIEESKKYILSKLKAAGCQIEIFQESGLEAIASYSKGNPRLLSKIANTCLLIGNNLNANTIDEEIVMQAINETEL